MKIVDKSLTLLSQLIHRPISKAKAVNVTHHFASKSEERVPLPLTQGQFSADELSTRPEKHNHWCCTASSLLNAHLSDQSEIILTGTCRGGPHFIFETEGPDTKMNKHTL